LFDWELALLDDDRIDEWEMVRDEIASPGLVLRPLDGRPDIAEFVIQFDAEKASWRY
jgi:hypothetical protein